jgi:hypothetical protein
MQDKTQQAKTSKQHSFEKREKERKVSHKKDKKKRLKIIQSFLHFFFLLFEDIKMGVTPSVSLATVKPPKTPFVLRKTAAPRRRNILSSWSSSFPPFPFRRKNPEKIVSVRRSSSSGTPKRSAGKKNHPRGEKQKERRIPKLAGLGVRAIDVSVDVRAD